MKLETHEYRQHPQQRKAFHTWLELLAQEADRKGITMQLILQQVAEVRPTKTLLKESVYKPLLKALTGLDSTEDQLTTDLNPIVDTIVKLFAGMGVVAPPWPERNQPR